MQCILNFTGSLRIPMVLVDPPKGRGKTKFCSRKVTWLAWNRLQADNSVVHRFHECVNSCNDRSWCWWPNTGFHGVSLNPRTLHSTLGQTLDNPHGFSFATFDDATNSGWLPPNHFKDCQNMIKMASCRCHLFCVIYIIIYTYYIYNYIYIYIIYNYTYII